MIGIQTYRVCLSSRRGKTIHKIGKEHIAFYNIQSSSPEKAVECAKRHCICLSGKISGTARPANAADLGCS
jgi:hypothetical protein